MSREFVTLTRGDPDFDAYLLGTFSRTERALPVETYHAQSYRERVTFQIVPTASLKKPAWWIIYFWACRPEFVPLTLGPAIAAWLNHRASMAQWTRWTSWSALVGVAFLHVAAFVFNDVQDHLHGRDRLNRRTGSRIIQKGWASAAEMRGWALLNFALALFFAVPAVLNGGWELAAVCGSAGACLIALALNFGTRWGMCDLALLFLFGPLLTVGIALASFGFAGEMDVWLGFAFGAMSLWVFQVRQFENLFRAKPEGFRTFLGHLNFNRAHWVTIVEGILLFGVHPAVGVLLRVPIVFLALLIFVSLPALILVQRIYHAASPLSSSLVGASRLARIAHFSWTMWWILALAALWV